MSKDESLHPSPVASLSSLPSSHVSNQLHSFSCYFSDVTHKCCHSSSIKFILVLSIIIFYFIFIGCLQVLLRVHVKVNLYHVVT